jgi:hypothetical protein
MQAGKDLQGEAAIGPAFTAGETAVADPDADRRAGERLSRTASEHVAQESYPRGTRILTDRSITCTTVGVRRRGVGRHTGITRADHACGSNVGREPALEGKGQKEGEQTDRSHASWCPRPESRVAPR